VGYSPAIARDVTPADVSWPRVGAIRVELRLLSYTRPISGAKWEFR
jgi:hypothetical protein